MAARRRLVHVLAAGASASSARVSAGSALVFAPAQRTDLVWIRGELKANGLPSESLDHANFIVARRSASQELVGASQLRPVAENSLELASVVVKKGERGCGIGSALVRSCLAHGLRDGAQPRPAVHCVLLSNRVPFYERFGFCVVDDERGLPDALQAKLARGRRVVKRLALPHSVVCMRLD